VVSVANPSPSAFTLRVALPRNLHAGGQIINPDAILNSIFVQATLDRLRDTLKWHVWWMGVEGLA
jgi:hypothetical protein